MNLAIRRVRSDIPTFEELHLPPAVQSLAAEPRGLVLVTGPTGTGKTTTIASMIGWINAQRHAHIVTIEDPIEIVHDDLLSIVDQREIGLDTESYRSALKYVVRQDPDVIFIGEIRDSETVEAALQAAETGHLVISTLHTLDAAETINRIIDLFPPEVHRQARMSLAGTLRGIVSQRLVARADGRGRVPAVEALINTGRVAERIADPEQTSTIPDVIAEGDFYGMQTFDQALVKLTKEGLVAEDEARRAATNPHDFDLQMGGVLDRLSASNAEGSPLLAVDRFVDRSIRARRGAFPSRDLRPDLQGVPPVSVPDREHEIDRDEQRSPRAELFDVPAFVREQSAGHGFR